MIVITPVILFLLSIRGAAFMELDLVIRNGMVVDGTGATRRRADIAMKDGRIAYIGPIKDSARASIDADGLIVCPGFVDPHTHYDAQISWDPLLNSSSEHGVTIRIVHEKASCGTNGQRVIKIRFWQTSVIWVGFFPFEREIVFLPFFDTQKCICV